MSHSPVAETHFGSIHSGSASSESAAPTDLAAPPSSAPAASTASAADGAAASSVCRRFRGQSHGPHNQPGAGSVTIRSDLRSRRRRLPAGPGETAGEAARPAPAALSKAGVAVGSDNDVVQDRDGAEGTDFAQSGRDLDAGSGRRRITGRVVVAEDDGDSPGTDEGPEHARGWIRRRRGYPARASGRAGPGVARRGRSPQISSTRRSAIRAPAPAAQKSPTPDGRDTVAAMKTRAS